MKQTSKAQSRGSPLHRTQASNQFVISQIVVGDLPIARRRSRANSATAIHPRGCAMLEFWNTVWLLISTFFFVAYLFVLLQIIVDLFRDTELSGMVKALWILGLIFLPVLTALIYIVTRGRRMANRQRVAGERMRAETDAYIKDVAGKSP